MALGGDNLASGKAAPEIGGVSHVRLESNQETRLPLETGFPGLAQCVETCGEDCNLLVCGLAHVSFR